MGLGEQGAWRQRPTGNPAPAWEPRGVCGAPPGRGTHLGTCLFNSKESELESHPRDGHICWCSMTFVSTKPQRPSRAASEASICRQGSGFEHVQGISAVTLAERRHHLFSGTAAEHAGDKPGTGDLYDYSGHSVPWRTGDGPQPYLGCPPCWAQASWAQGLATQALPTSRPGCNTQVCAFLPAPCQPAPGGAAQAHMPAGGHPHPSRAQGWTFGRGSLEVLRSESRGVSTHASKTPDTHHVLGGERLETDGHGCTPWKQTPTTPAAARGNSPRTPALTGNGPDFLPTSDVR